MDTIHAVESLRQERSANPVSATDGRKHILFLDDDGSLVFLVTRMLEKRGYRVSGYTNQHDALAALKSAPASFDIMVTDYNMPGMTGLDVARQARQVRADLPVVMASGSITEDLRANVAQAPVLELISKGLDIQELCAAIERLAKSTVTGR